MSFCSQEGVLQPHTLLDPVTPTPPQPQFPSSPYFLNSQDRVRSQRFEKCHLWSSFTWSCVSNKSAMCFRVRANAVERSDRTPQKLCGFSFCGGFSWAVCFDVLKSYLLPVYLFACNTIERQWFVVIRNSHFAHTYKQNSRASVTAHTHTHTPCVCIMKETLSTDVHFYCHEEWQRASTTAATVTPSPVNAGLHTRSTSTGSHFRSSSDLEQFRLHRHQRDL